MADPLIGKFFISFQTNKGEQGLDRRVTWNGQIRNRVKEGMYLVKLMNAIPLMLAGVVSFDKQVMVSLDDMKDWEFFDSPEAWSESYGMFAQRPNERIRQERRDTNFSASGSSPGAQS